MASKPTAPVHDLEDEQQQKQQNGDLSQRPPPAGVPQNSPAGDTTPFGAESGSGKHRVPPEQTEQPPCGARGVRNLVVNLTRLWVSCVLAMTTTMMGVVTSSSLRVQYLDYRIGVDEYNYTGDYDETGSSSNGSSGGDSDEISVLVETEVSLIIIYLTLAANIPSAVTCLLVGSYSDFLGRKPILVAAIFGNFCRPAAVAIVAYFNLNIDYLYLGAFIEGTTGSNFTVALAMTATLTDITPDRSKRATRFAILQLSQMVGSAIGQLAVGYMIMFWGYAVPAFVGAGLGFFALLVTIFAVPETLIPVKPQYIEWNPLIHLKKVVSFYFTKSHGSSRTLYITGLMAYLLGDVISGGRIAVDTMYFLAPPISWDSVDIGIFTSSTLVLLAGVAVIFIRTLRRHLSLEIIGMIAAVSLIAGFVVLGLAESGLWVYISTAAGFLTFAVLPIPRAMLSLLTSPAEQGALFSSLAFMDAAADMFSGTLSSYIYQQTLAFFNGAVILVLAGVAVILILMLFVFYVKRRSLEHIKAMEPEAQPALNEGQGHEADEKTPLLT